MTQICYSTATPIFNQNDAALFFGDPLDDRDGLSPLGTLYILRREVDFCMQIDRKNQRPRPTGARALWAGAVTIMAGIDLLAKFSTGDDSIGGSKVGDRFKGFLADFFGLNTTEQVLLWDLRSALVHAFSLRFKSNEREVGLMFNGSCSLISGPAQFPIVDLWALYTTFEKAVGKYCNDVYSKPELQPAFAKMFGKYGQMFTTELIPGAPTPPLGLIWQTPRLSTAT